MRTSKYLLLQKGTIRTISCCLISSVLLLIGLAVSSCTPSSGESATFSQDTAESPNSEIDAQATLTGTRWLLISFVNTTGALSVPNDPIPYLEITEKSLEFDNGCNKVTANHSADGSVLHIERAILRGIDCTNRVSPEAIVLETAVLDSLATWSTYEITGDTLTIQFENGSASFRRDQADSETPDLGE
jgi:heat shock protein HslJ